MDEHLRIIQNITLGSLVKKYSANGLFFTDEEFEANKGEILNVAGAMARIKEHILKEKNN